MVRRRSLVRVQSSAPFKKAKSQYYWHYLYNLEYLRKVHLFIFNNLAAWTLVISLLWNLLTISLKLSGSLYLGLPKWTPFSFAILILYAWRFLMFSLSFWATKERTSKTISEIKLPTKFMPSSLVSNKGKSIINISASITLVISLHSLIIIS